MLYKSNDLHHILNLACYKHTGRFLPADEECENRWKYILTLTGCGVKRLAVQPSPTANWFRPSFFNDFSQQVNRRIITDSIKHLFTIPKYSTEVLPKHAKKLVSKWEDKRVYGGKFSIDSLPCLRDKKIDPHYTREKIAHIHAEISCDYHDIGFNETDREFMKDIMEFYKLTNEKYKYGFLKKKDWYNIYRKFFRKYDETFDDIITWEEFRKIPATANSIMNGVPSPRGGNEVEYISSGSIDTKLSERRLRRCAVWLGCEGVSTYNYADRIKNKFLTKSRTFRKRPESLLYDWFEKVFLYNLSNNTYPSESVGRYCNKLPNDDPNNRIYQPHSARANYHHDTQYQSVYADIEDRTLGYGIALTRDRRKQGWFHAKYSAVNPEFTMAELTSMFHKTDGRYEALIRRLSHQ